MRRKEESTTHFRPFLSRLDGQWSVSDIVEIAPMREVETIRVLRRLIRRGLVRLPVAWNKPAPVGSGR